MGYPIENNILEVYLKKLRVIEIERNELYKNLFNSSVNSDNRKHVLDDINQNLVKLRELESSKLPARTFDVFLSEADLAIKEFYDLNPQPKKPEPCNHNRVELRLKTHQNNSTHVCSQCLECGTKVYSFKKNDSPEWQNLPEFDMDIAKKRNLEYINWFEKKDKLYHSLFKSHDDLFKFDNDSFMREYELHNPKPISSRYECLHFNKKITRRKYENSSLAIVLQCLDCGKHIQSLSKKTVSDIALLDEFNYSLEQEKLDELVIWEDEYSKALNEAQNIFHTEISKKIANREIILEDKTRFGTYYSSLEWKKTRERILYRDNFLCQSCQKPAECVHHIIYERLGCENDLDLISLCTSCHNEVHKRQNSLSYSFKLTPTEIMTLLSCDFE